MERGISIVVSRTDDRVVIMMPDRADDDRNHAIVSEDEAFFAASCIRRMVQSRDRRCVETGAEGSGLRIERVDHPTLPVELHLDDDEGTTIVDLTRDDALGLADMLWAAHRSTGPFHGMTGISGGRRRIDRQAAGATGAHIAEAPASGIASLLGGLNRRVRGESQKPKG